MSAGVFIGRCQPLHHGHIAVISQMIDDTDTHVVLLGSANQHRTIKNPYTFEERRDEVLSIFPNVLVLPLNDYVYNDKVWRSDVMRILRNFEDVIIYGHSKPGNDYLNWFGDFKYVEVASGYDINSTSIRLEGYQEGSMPANAQADYEFYEREKQLFATYPFPETLQFNCADALLIRFPPGSDTHNNILLSEILLIKRKFAPGAGAWAMPGGFKNNDETFFECARRELKEEAGVDIDASDVEDGQDMSFYTTTKLFDSPKRAVGTIPRVTMCVVFQAADENYNPVIKADDDAAEVKWFTLSEILNEVNMFHDHRDMISTIWSEWSTPFHLHPKFTGLVDASVTD